MKRKKLISVVLSLAFTLSSGIGEGVGALADRFTVFAEENSEGSNMYNDRLGEGTYVAPLYRIANITNNSYVANSAMHFSGQAIIKVDAEGNQSLTFGVENWSLYDALIPCKQSYYSEVKVSKFPTNVFNEANLDKLTDLTSYYPNAAHFSDDANDWYDYGNIKFGNYKDYSLNNDLDYALLTINIDDYNKPFMFAAWTNTTAMNTGKVADHKQPVTLRLDTEHLVDISNIAEKDTIENLSYKITIPTNRYITGVPLAFTQNFVGDEKASKVFDSVEVQCSHDEIIATYTINSEYDYTNFKIPESVMHDSEQGTMNWDIYNCSDNDYYDVSNGSISVKYSSVEDAMLGRLIYFDIDTTDEMIYYCYASLSPLENIPITFTDDETGIIVKTNTSAYPFDATMVVEHNQPIYVVKEGITYDITSSWSPEVYDATDWYSVVFYDANGNKIKSSNSVDIYVPLPDNYSDLEIKILEDNGSIYDSTSTGFHRSSIENGYIVRKGYSISDVTFAFLKPTALADVFNLKDGIYTAYINFTHEGQQGLTSMADGAIADNRKVYIISDNGIKKMYFKIGTVMYTYIGDIFCDAGAIHDGAVYDESISYTDFLLNGNGELSDNLGFDPYTECGCVKGGVLTLMNESWVSDANAYVVALMPTAMIQLGGTTKYSSAKKDDTVAWLEFTHLEKCDESVTLDTILNEGYGYHSSALLRKIKQAELYDSNKYSAESFASLTSAIETAQGVYEQSFDDAASASHAYEAQITALDEAIANLKEPEVTVSGYQASVADDVTLNYVLNIPDALEDKADNGKLMATITYADGTTKEIAVQVEDEYFVPVSVAPKEIANEISVTIGDGTFTYSVKEYLESVVNSETATDNEKAVAKSLLNYAGCAQDYFKAKNADANAYLSDTKANENVDSTLADITDDDVKAFDAPTLGDNVSFYGASLTCDYDTSIKMYFKVTDDIANHTFTANGETVEAVEAADGIYCITYSGISAKNLATAYTFSVDGTSFTYGAYNYIYAALNATEVQSGALTELQNMVKAIYYYAEAAKLA